jgi:hypothetical protein
VDAELSLTNAGTFLLSKGDVEFWEQFGLFANIDESGNVKARVEL